MFCGWQLMNSYRALEALGSGTLLIDALTGACAFDGKPIPELSIARVLKSWLADDLAAQSIPTAAIRRAELTVTLTLSRIAAAERKTLDWHMDRRQRPIAEGPFNRCAIRCRGEIETDEKLYAASGTDIEEWPLGWPAAPP